MNFSCCLNKKINFSFFSTREINFFFFLLFGKISLVFSLVWQFFSFFLLFVKQEKLISLVFLLLFLPQKVTSSNSKETFSFFDHDAVISHHYLLQSFHSPWLQVGTNSLGCPKGKWLIGCTDVVSVIVLVVISVISIVGVEIGIGIGGVERTDNYDKDNYHTNDNNEMMTMITTLVMVVVLVWV